MVNRLAEDPTVLNFTHWKAGSTWQLQILSEVANNRIVLPQPDVSQFLQQPILPGMIYPRLYVTKEQADSVCLHTVGGILCCS